MEGRKGKGKATDRGSKRSRKEPSPTPNLNPTLNDLGIEFREPSEVARFTVLRQKRIRPTQFPDIPALKALDVYSNVRRFHTGFGCGDFLELHEKTYERITLEFLSTMRKDFTTEICGDTGEPYQLIHLYFRLGGEEFHLTSFDINRILGWPAYTNYEIDFPIEFRENVFWEQITRIPSFKSRTAKALSIIHPVLRLMHRFHACTIFAREDKGTVNKKELFLLWSLVRAHRRVNLSHFLIELFGDIVSPTFNGEIHIGGIITLFANHFRRVMPDNEAAVSGSTKLDIPTLRIMQMISDRGRGEYNWLVEPSKMPYIVLPSPILPVARTHQFQTWIFPNSMIQWEGQSSQANQEEEEEEEGEQHHPNPPQLSPNFNDRFDRIELQNNQIMTRLDTFNNEFHYFRNDIQNRVNTIQRQD